MKKITDFTSITDRDITMGIFVNHIGTGFGTSKVGLVVMNRGQYYIQWADGHESIREYSFAALGSNYGTEVEYYKLNP